MSDSGKRISRYIGLVALSGSLTTFGLVGVSSLASATTNGGPTSGSSTGGGGSINGGNSDNGGGGNINGGSSRNGGGGNIGGGTTTTKAPTTSSTSTTRPTTTTTRPTTTTTQAVTHGTVVVPVHRVVVPAHRVSTVVHGVTVSNLVPAQVETVSSGAAPSSALAFTGLNSLWLSLSALMLLFMGAALLQFGRPGSAHAMSMRKQLATIWGHSTD